MNFKTTGLEGSFLIEPKILGDERGWFMRTYSSDVFSEAGYNKPWVQMNHSFTAHRGTVRGMHFQQAPNAEIKLVRCVAGIVWDVIVDLRKNSPTYLKWFGAELSSINRRMMLVPEGFAHGFQTIEPNSELVYCHSAVYDPSTEGGVKYNDPAINIEWPLDVEMVSDRDNNFPLLNADSKFNF